MAISHSKFQNKKGLAKVASLTRFVVFIMIMDDFEEVRSQAGLKCHFGRVTRQVSLSTISFRSSWVRSSPATTSKV